MIDPRIAPIGQAAVSSLIRGGGVGDLYRLDKIAERDEIPDRATWTPARAPCPDLVEDFDRAFLKRLDEYAGDYLRSGELWTAEPPFFAATLPPAQDARP